MTGWLRSVRRRKALGLHRLKTNSGAWIQLPATRRTRIIFASFLGIGENQNH